MSLENDVFISHVPADTGRAEQLAAGLRDEGLTVFLDCWEIDVGDHIMLKLDAGIRGARVGVLVVSRQWQTHLQALEEYAALATRTMNGKLDRLVPVLFEPGIELPPLLASRQASSFAGVHDKASFLARVADLAAALRGSRDRTPVEFDLGSEPDDTRLHDTPAQITLVVEATATTLITETGKRTSSTHQGITTGLRHALWTTERAQYAADRAVRSEIPVPASDNADLDQASRDVGVQLAAAFLPPPLAGQLSDVLAATSRSGRVTHLALELPDDDEEIAGLPWESLAPGEAATPVSLDPGVRVYRHIPDLGKTAGRRIPRPLRILAVIASPDVGSGELLDYEYELASILDQVNDVRVGEEAYVRILNWGSLRAIHDALREEDFHILHVSCHAAPGLLHLETTDGQLDRVTAARFAEELRFPQDMPPLVVLAGCRTAVADRDSAARTALPSFARELIRRGVPSVIAMNTDVSDEYATRLLSRAYHELAAHRDGPDALTAVSSARQLVELERQALPPTDPSSLLAEWATPVLYQRVRHNLLYDPASGPAPVRDRPRTPLPRSIVDLRLGDFVGRRRELRTLLRALTGAGTGTPGVLIHGMGGVGKSSLAAALVHMLGERAVVVAVRGPQTVDQLLARIGTVLSRRLRSSGRTEAIAEYLDELGDQTRSWEERLDVLEELAARRPAELVLVLDDPVGDPLESAPGTWSQERATHGELEPELARFLDTWLRLRCETKLVITSRLPFTLPGEQLLTHHLGPLSYAETRKLIFRLPEVDALPPADQLRAYQLIGGHPRALEYLDAVLSGGHYGRAARRGSSTQFSSIKERLTKALAVHGIDLASWRQTAGADLDTALTETAAVASADILLDQLQSGLTATFKPAYQLLLALSVHRRPVDATALRWTAAGGMSADPDRSVRLEQAYTALAAMQREGNARSRADLDLPRAAHEQLNRDLSVGALPPTPPWLTDARERLERLTLLTPVPPAADGGTAAGGDNTVRYVVHRWTAMSLASSADPGDMAAVHRTAAAYHRWRANLWRTEPYVHLEELEEARYHSLQAGDQEQALAVTAEMCAVLELRGAGDWEWDLCDQALATLASQDARGRVFRHRKSVVAARRGRYADAEQLQRSAQQAAISVGDQVAEAVGLAHLGAIAQLRGDITAAEANYRDAVRAAGREEIRDQLDARITLALCYQRLGGIAIGRSDEEESERFSIGALEVAGEVSTEVEADSVHRDLAELARALGDVAGAGEHERRANHLAAVRTDVLRLLAAASLQLGAVHLARHMLTDAMDHLDPALRLASEVGDQPLLATCEQLWGETLLQLGDLERAQLTYQRFAELAEDLDDRGGMVVAHQQLGRIALRMGDQDTAVSSLRRAMSIARTVQADVLVAATHLVTGTVLVGCDRSKDAVEEFAEGRRLADELGQNGLAMGCVIQLALVRLREGDRVGAAKLFAEGFTRANALGSRRGRAVCLLAMAIVARQSGDVKQAADWHEQALELAEQERNPRLLAECLARQADFHLDHGAIDDAEDGYRRCLAALGQVTAPDLRAQVLRQLGRCRADRSDHVGTVDVLRTAADEFGTLKRDDDQLACLVRLAWALPRAGRPATARHAMRKIGWLATGRPPSPAVVVGLLVAGEEALARGDVATADMYAEQVRIAARVLGDRSLIVDSLCLLGAVASAAEEFDRARDSLESARVIGSRQRDRIIVMHLHRELGRVLFALGDERAAVDHFAKSAALATGPNERTASLAASLLSASPPADEDSVAAAVSAAEDDFAELRWLRRLRAVDGETAFAEQTTTYLGPSIDEIVRDLVPAFSGASAVPAVVSPSTAVRVR